MKSLINDKTRNSFSPRRRGKPYGFPSGQELLEKVYKHLDLKIEIARIGTVVERLGFSTSEINEFRTALSRSGQNSVDAFLEHNKEFEKIGKAAIAEVLLKYESSVHLFEGKRTENWYQLLFSAMITNSSFEEFGDNKLTIITYNYDRSLEHFLFTALKNSYHSKSYDECIAQISKLNIYHLHGTLGKLPWQTKDENLVVNYDLSNISAKQVQIASQSIKIIHESEKIENSYEQAHICLQTAKRIYFLGFGYHLTNLTRLIGSLNYRQNIYIGGTMYEMSLSAKKAAISKITKFGTLGFLSLEDNFPNEEIYEYLYNRVVF